MVCQICGAKSRYYSLCKKHNEIRETGEVVKCEGSKKWYLTSEGCWRCKEMEKAGRTKVDVVFVSDDKGPLHGILLRELQAPPTLTKQAHTLLLLQLLTQPNRCFGRNLLHSRIFLRNPEFKQLSLMFGPHKEYRARNNGRSS